MSLCNNRATLYVDRKLNNKKDGIRDQSRHGEAKSEMRWMYSYFGRYMAGNIAVRHAVAVINKEQQ